VGALEAHRRALAITPNRLADATFVAQLALRAANFAKADSLLAQFSRSSDLGERSQGQWWLVISRRLQGRLADALAIAESLHRETSEWPTEQQRNAAWDNAARMRAQVLLEMGRSREAAELLDSDYDRQPPNLADLPGIRARHEAWLTCLRGTAWAAAGDTTRVAALADTLRIVGARSAYGRDPRLHHHLRGLLEMARGRRERAVAEFRRAMWSPAAGYTRTNLELGRVLLELGRPDEAIAVLRPALHGALDASQLYVTHTEIHALLARGFTLADGAGHADSAATHRRWVERAVAAADPPARARITALLGATPDDGR
jgi:tetratricopeptide (TPR) repeat protein